MNRHKTFWVFFSSLFSFFFLIRQVLWDISRMFSFSPHSSSTSPDQFRAERHFWKNYYLLPDYITLYYITGDSYPGVICLDASCNRPQHHPTPSQDTVASQWICLCRVKLMTCVLKYSVPLFLDKEKESFIFSIIYLLFLYNFVFNSVLKYMNT